MPRSCHGVRLSTLVLTAQVVFLLYRGKQTDRQTDKVTEEAKNKKLSYRRGTARCVVSVEVLPIAMQECRNSCTTSPEQIEVMKLEG